ncbi:MAG TPA: hypothetical protein PLU17_02660 [Chitinophagaceae bacterium]|nr:hypothetical protein [Chitinophagaceae bacterium]
MKKVFLSLICLIAIIGFSSCNKDYTCSCTFTDSSKNFDVKLEKMRKNDAKTVCDDYSVYVGNCVIK